MLYLNRRNFFFLFINLAYLGALSSQLQDRENRNQVRSISTKELRSDTNLIKSNVTQQHARKFTGVKKISTSDFTNICCNDFYEERNDFSLYSNFLRLSSINGNGDVLDRSTFISWNYLTELIDDQLIFPYMIDESLNQANVTSVLSFSQFETVMNTLDKQRRDYQIDLLGPDISNFTDSELYDLLGGSPYDFEAKPEDMQFFSPDPSSQPSLIR